MALGSFNLGHLLLYFLYHEVKGLLVKESNGNEVVAVSLNINPEEASIMVGLVRPDMALSGVVSTSREQEENQAGEKDEASAKNATACCEMAAEKGLNWNADATRQHAFSPTAEVGNIADETVSDHLFSQKSTNISPMLEVSLFFFCKQLIYNLL